MKKLLTTISAALFFCFTIKAQHIPDNNFANAIRKTCSDCIDANNNLLPAAQNLRKLDVSFADIENLEGVEGFSSLTELDCAHNERLTSLNKLPATLIELRCYVTGINNIVSLPPNLKTLICRVTPIASLPALPATLEELDCQETGLTSLPPLPASLIFLYANNSPIKNLPKLPGKLRFLYIANTKITSLPDLPAGLASLVISDNVFDCIPYNNNPDLSIKDVDLNPSKTTFCKANQKINVIAEKKSEQGNGKCISGNCKNGIGVYVTKDGEVITSTYKGSFKDGKFDGKGAFTSTVGSYTGDFKNDLMEGNGTLVFKNGKKQTGIFKEGKLWSGTGYFEIGEKEFYYGRINENRPDGQGVYNFSDGRKYDGSFKNGKLDGYGVMTYTDGWVYKGNWKNGDRNGTGSIYDANGDLDYNGEWYEGKMQHPMESVSLGKEAEKSFSRITFKGYAYATVQDQDGKTFVWKVGITSEFHLRNNWLLYGTTEQEVVIDGSTYRRKVSFTGEFGVQSQTVYCSEEKTISSDPLPDGYFFMSGEKWHGILGDDRDHPGYHIIEGKNEQGNRFQIHDY